LINLGLEYYKKLTLPYKDKRIIENLRLERLRRIILNAKGNVPFYKEKYIGINVEDIRSAEDIQLLPIIKSKELKTRETKEITSEFADLKNCVLLSTSGTSGVPFKVYISPREDVLRQLVLLIFLRRYGWCPWWKGVNLQFPVKKVKMTALQKLINVRRFYVPTDLPLTEQLDLILSIRPDFIYGLTSSVYVLANYMIKKNIKYNKAKFIGIAGNILTDDVSSLLLKAFGHPGVDYYGANEVGFIGCDCPQCDLKYFDNAENIIEILDENDKPVKPGETGRAIITSLNNYITPFIRYDIGDVITTAPLGHQCKINYTHYKSVDGRVADILTLKNREFLHIAHVSRYLQDFKQVQFYQRKDGHVIIKYVPKYQQDNQHFLDDLLENVRLTGFDDVSFEKCDFIPLEPSGKYKILKKE